MTVCWLLWCILCGIYTLNEATNRNVADLFQSKDEEIAYLRKQLQKMKSAMNDVPTIHGNLSVMDAESIIIHSAPHAFQCMIGTYTKYYKDLVAYKQHKHLIGDNFARKNHKIFRNKNHKTCTFIHLSHAD